MSYSSQCRATNKGEGPPRYSQSWVNSIKDKLKITDNQIFCGPWHINPSDIISAHLYNVKTFFNIPYCKVLEIKTEQDCFQFGLNPWSKAHKYIPIAYSESDCRMIGKPFRSYSKEQKQRLFLLFAAIFLICLALKLI